MSKPVVVDAGVFTKLYYDEPDSFEALAFFETCIRTDTQLLVPQLFKYEIAQTSRYVDYPLAKCLELLQAHEQTIMTIIDPASEAWLLAEEITRQGHRKSGFPSMYDSIYHAMAIQSGGTFLTADKKHQAKSAGFGHILLLEDWERIFINPQT